MQSAVSAMLVCSHSTSSSTVFSVLERNGHDHLTDDLRRSNRRGASHDNFNDFLSRLDVGIAGINDFLNNLGHACGRRAADDGFGDFLCDPRRRLSPTITSETSCVTRCAIYAISLIPICPLLTLATVQAAFVIGSWS